MSGELRRIATVNLTVDIAMKDKESAEHLEMRLSDWVLDLYDVIEVETDVVSTKRGICQPENPPEE